MLYSTVPKVQLKTSTSSSRCAMLGITTSTFILFLDEPLLSLSVPAALRPMIGTSLAPFSISMAQLLVASANRRPRSSGGDFGLYSGWDDNQGWGDILRSRRCRLLATCRLKGLAYTQVVKVGIEINTS